MKKILITGIAGFVGHHFLQFLYDNKIETDVLGIDINEPTYSVSKYKEIISFNYINVNLLDDSSVNKIISDYKPNFVLHLASFSSVAYSWNYPTESFLNNTNIFMNLVNAIHKYGIDCRILSVGSSEEYGNVSKEDIPIKERQRLKPTSPYGVARVSQEMLSQLYVDNFGLDIVLTRSFNHIGPWQDERFVVPSFVKRIFEIKKSGKSEGIIYTGDVSVVRDFVDVRDVVRAYWMLLQKGKKGQIYNVCSGRARTLSGVIDSIASLMNMRIRYEIKEEYVRPNENKIVVGSNFKIFDEIGWEPEISFNRTISDIIEDVTMSENR